MQGELLKLILPEGARVGTVDKFQGQEAPVVLVSMVTSSGDDLPRNIEFLYSRNRLNVAISRARCLAVVFANPRLREIPCSTIRSEEHTSELQSLMRITYAVFCLKKKRSPNQQPRRNRDRLNTVELL